MRTTRFFAEQKSQETSVLCEYATMSQDPSEICTIECDLLKCVKMSGVSLLFKRRKECSSETMTNGLDASYIRIIRVP